MLIIFADVCKFIYRNIKILKSKVLSINLKQTIISVCNLHLSTMYSSVLFCQLEFHYMQFHPHTAIRTYGYYRDAY